MEEIFSFIGKVVAYGGGTVALAYVLFMFLGQKWIEEKFSERLEAFKHEQERELEHYRHQVNILFSRVTKIHEKEIEVLPVMWKKLQDSLGYVAKITSPAQFGPSFRTMTPEDFQEFLEKSRLSDSHKKALTNSPDKEDFYFRTIFWYDLQDAKSAVNDFHNFMLYNSIFLSKDLKHEFKEIDKLLSSALTRREIGERARDWDRIFEGFKGLGEEAGKIVERIEELVQERLEFGKATPFQK